MIDEKNVWDVLEERKREYDERIEKQKEFKKEENKKKKIRTAIMMVICLAIIVIPTLFVYYRENDFYEGVFYLFSLFVAVFVMLFFYFALLLLDLSVEEF